MSVVRTQDERRTMVPTSSTASTRRYFQVSDLRRTRHLFLLCSNRDMTDRPASWRVPTEKQMEKLAATAAARGNVPPTRTPGPGNEMPPEYWQVVLDEVETDPGTPGPVRDTATSAAGLLPSLRPHRRDPDGRRRPPIRRRDQVEDRRAAAARQHLSAANRPP